MVAHINTVAFAGIDVLPIEAQVAISGGLPTFTIVGLPDKAVGESKERVRMALFSWRAKMRTYLRICSARFLLSCL